MNEPRRAGIYIEKDDSWEESAWTAIPNALLRHPELSWEAKGAFGWLASHTSSFALKADDLAKYGTKGRNHARGMLRELEQHGYLTRHKVRNPETGHYDVHIYRLHPNPVSEDVRTFTPSTAKRREFPTFDQESDNPSSEPAPYRPGAGQPGAGQPGPGHAGAFKKTTREEQLRPTTTAHTARERAEPTSAPPPQCEPEQAPVLDDAQDFAAARVQRNRARHNRGAAALNDTAHLPASRPIVDAFTAECPVPLAPGVVAKWRASVSELLRLGVPVPVIEQAMAECRAAGLSPSLLADVAAQVGNRSPGGRQAAQPPKPSTTTIRLAETESLRAWARAEDEAEAAALAAGQPLRAIGASR